MSSSAASPVPTPGSKILLTGASGFIAVHCIESLLAEGYQVVGTVRSPEKGDYLKDLFKGKPFEYVIVKDIEEENAFDEAVKGVEGVLHTASPFHMKAKTVDELVGPAVKGTVGVLKSAKKNGSSIKRVVITSSVASIQNANDTTEAKVWTEEDWNTFSVSEIEEKKDDSAAFHKYMASKTLAERAAWAFEKEEKPEFSLAMINPPYVLGPVIHQVSSLDQINTSVGVFVPTAQGQTKASDLPGPIGNWVDVRDVADAHVKALSIPKAGGQRFIVSAGPVCKQDFTDSLLLADSSLSGIPKGEKGAAAEANKKSQVFTGAKAARELGIVYHTIEDSTKDMYESIKRFL